MIHEDKSIQSCHYRVKDLYFRQRNILLMLLLIVFFAAMEMLALKLHRDSRSRSSVLWRVVAFQCRIRTLHTELT